MNCKQSSHLIKIMCFFFLQFAQHTLSARQTEGELVAGLKFLVLMSETAQGHLIFYTQTVILEPQFFHMKERQSSSISTNRVEKHQQNNTLEGFKDYYSLRPLWVLKDNINSNNAIHAKRQYILNLSSICK